MSSIECPGCQLCSLQISSTITRYQLRYFYSIWNITWDGRNTAPRLDGLSWTVCAVKSKYMTFCLYYNTFPHLFLGHWLARVCELVRSEARQLKRDSWLQRLIRIKSRRCIRKLETKCCVNKRVGTRDRVMVGRDVLTWSREPTGYEPHGPHPMFCDL
jgi:hypothetical protein